MVKALHCYRGYFCTTMQKMEEVTEVYYYNNILEKRNINTTRIPSEAVRDIDIDEN